VEKYNTENLYVGNLVVFPSEFEFTKEFDYAKLDGIKITKQKYIFNKISNDEYKEIFSGMTTIIWPELSCQRHIPYIINLEPIAYYIPKFELRDNIDNVDFLIALEMVNNILKEDKEENIRKIKQKR